MTELKERVSPWAQFSEQRRASARKYNDLRNQLGLAFRPAQQEAYEQWEALQKELGEEDTAPHPTE